MSQVITDARQECIGPFTGLTPRQFRKLVRLVAERGGAAVADGRPGRQWALPPADRVLLVAVYWRTNLTLRQVGPLFGISHAAAHRVVDTLSPLPALAPVRRRGPEQVCIAGGTLVPLRDRSPAARSKNYRLLGQRADRHRRRHPPGRRRRRPGTGQSQATARPTASRASTGPWPGGT